MTQTNDDAGRARKAVAELHDTTNEQTCRARKAVAELHDERSGDSEARPQ